VPEVALRVLAVEAVLRDLWIEIFREAGHEVAGAESAGDARSNPFARRYDAAVLDLHPASQSWLSVETVAAYTNPDCKVIMIAGSALFANSALFDMAPAVSTVLRKPVPLEELLAVSELRAIMA
jgi:DNA-binding NtrC family response regulator